MEGPYPLPKDMAEVNRLDFQHFLLRNGFGGNYAAPIRNPLSILDVGCGTGRWAMEMAQYFPQASVIGMDIVLPAVDERAILGNGLDTRPANYTFVEGNIFNGVPLPEKTFDFVHQRLLITAIPQDTWDSVIAELIRVTRPGGWIELAEVGVPQSAGPHLSQLWGSWIQLTAKRGVDFTMGHTIGDRLRRAGLKNATLRSRNFPMGAWGGRLGKMSATDCLATGEALKGPVVATGLMSEPDYTALMQAARQELEQTRGKAVLPFYVAYGQRAL